MITPGSTAAEPPRCLIVIGASTGGTRVLPELFRAIRSLNAWVLVVQHMPKFINVSLARTLSQCTTAEVRLAADGDKVTAGRVLVAPSEVHCALLENRSVRLRPGPDVNYVCPSIDVAMQSLGPLEPGQKVIGVLLTGMGKDGAAGLAHIKRLGGLTIIQNKATCAVYGMPAEAAKLGCVDYQLAPDQIAALLAQEAR